MPDIIPADRVLNFQQQIEAIESRGENLSNYEIQQTKSGFLLRNKNSFWTKVSKFFLPKQYDASKNIATLAKSTLIAATMRAPNLDLERIRNALSTLHSTPNKEVAKIGKLTGADRKAWITTGLALTALGGTITQQRKEALSTLNSATTRFAQSAQTQTKLPDSLKEPLETIRKTLKECEALKGSPEFREALEEVRIQFFSAIVPHLNPEKIGEIALFPHDRLGVQLRQLYAQFDYLTDNHNPQIPQAALDVFRKLEELRPTNATVIQKFLLPLGRELKDLESANPDKLKSIKSDPSFIEMRNYTTATLLKRYEEGVRVEPVTVQCATWREKAIPASIGTEKIRTYAQDNPLIKKWLPKFSDQEAVFKTFGRNSVAEMEINGVPLKDLEEDLTVLMQTKGQEFTQVFRVAALAERLEANLKTLAPSLSEKERTDAVLDLLSVSAIDYNPMSYPPSVQELLQTYNDPMNEAGFSFGGSPESPKTAFRFTIGMQGDTPQITVTRNAAYSIFTCAPDSEPKLRTTLQAEATLRLNPKEATLTGTLTTIPKKE